MANLTHQQCDALRRLNPNVVSIWGDQASDKDGNPIVYYLGITSNQSDVQGIDMIKEDIIKLLKNG